MKKFGFGCMRLPMLTGEVGGSGEVDLEQVSKMVDLFLDNGFTYFDTAHGYISGSSETAMRECLVKRHPRDSFTLTDKLTGNYWQKQEDIRPLFEKQLEACGVTYFDYYLMHALTNELYDRYKSSHAFEEVLALKKEGKIRHMGISFHDKAYVLDRILKEQPEIEYVQIQYNYRDITDSGVESDKVYDVCVKYNKPVIVMEPCKGGALADRLPDQAKGILNALHGGSPASYAIRFAASQPQVFMVLSGMGTLEQAQDNISYMKDFKPLDDTERKAVGEVVDILHGMNTIARTACHYCTDGCPKKIRIPDLFSCYNAKQMYKDWNSSLYYSVSSEKAGAGKASDCIRCGQCARVCPQHLPIPDLLQKVAEEFEKGDKKA